MTHQVFLPFMCETKEDILTRTLQALRVILDEAQEALNVSVLLKVHGKYVPQWSTVSPVSARLANRP